MTEGMMGGGGPEGLPLRTDRVPLDGEGRRIGGGGLRVPRKTMGGCPIAPWGMEGALGWEGGVFSGPADCGVGTSGSQ